jgi:hypothetical protein
VVVFDVWIDHPVAWIARLVGNTVGLQPATSWDDDNLERERERERDASHVIVFWHKLI